ncbi:hypothetical protein JOY44_19370 [Phormidium sp. CLA17]|uniref:hypothetical protein n=1 Tax=Leptolyngbya sp. Cla-17 TaxID=2803751 RepID=UPI0019330839|nr:hypothetical protein [Leptolyngbya sp. Cla-17]MBM0743751.1 hypothetical protein [Leptolyngbya sp. Cla-17]
MLAPGRRRPPLLIGMGYFVANPTSEAGAATTVAGAFVAVVEAGVPLEAFADARFSLPVDFLVWVGAFPFPDSTIAAVVFADAAFATAGLAD